MSNYVTYWANLDEGNRRTLYEAKRYNSTAELVFANFEIRSGNTPFIFLPRQKEKIKKAISIGTNVRLKFSKRHVRDLIDRIEEWERQDGGNLFGSLVGKVGSKVLPMA